MKPKIIFSTPIYSTNQYPQWHYCLELIQSIKHAMPAESYLHIIVNDGSTDKTSEVLTKMAKKDNNIVLVNIDKTDGTHAFNLGIDISIDPNKHRHLLSTEDLKKIKKLQAQYISFIGVDDLYGGDYYNQLLEANRYPQDHVLFYGNYKSFLKHNHYSRVEFSPYRTNLKELYQQLLLVENFPSHTIMFRKKFVKELKKYRNLELGILNPNFLSPIAYDMMLEATKLSIAKKYQFGFLLGNMGYKRYGIEGTMTEKNKKAGRYPKERKFVYEANKDYMKKNNIPFASQRPKLDSLYFKRLEDEKETIKDLCLKKILQEVNN